MYLNKKTTSFLLPSAPPHDLLQLQYTESSFPSSSSVSINKLIKLHYSTTMENKQENVNLSQISIIKKPNVVVEEGRCSRDGGSSGCREDEEQKLYSVALLVCVRPIGISSISVR